MNNKIRKVNRACIILLICAIVFGSNTFIFNKQVRAQNSVESGFATFIDILKTILGGGGEDKDGSSPESPPGGDVNEPAEGVEYNYDGSIVGQDDADTIPPTCYRQDGTPINPLIPYSHFGLNYYVPLRNPAIRPRPDLREFLRSPSFPIGNHARQEYIDIITSFAQANNWNPVFLLTLWIEETGGSHYTLQPYGNATEDQRHGMSHTGYYPFGPARPIGDELRWVNIHMTFNNEQFANFMSRHSGGGCIDTNGDGQPDGGVEAYNNICTINPFRNNPNFIRNFLNVYLALVSSEDKASVQYDSGAVIICPTVTPGSGVPTSTPGPAATPPVGFLKDPTYAESIGESFRALCPGSQPRYYSDSIAASNVTTCVDPLSGTTDGFKSQVRYSATNYTFLQCVGLARALAYEITGKEGGLGHACQQARDSTNYKFIAYTGPPPDGPAPMPGDQIIWCGGGDYSSLGHIAFISRVLGPSTIRVVEAHMNGKGSVSYRDVALNSYVKGYLRKK